ncbi:MAG: hypothetical protein AAGA83_06130 [Cyanobacteria bacterium P01_F01_bin.116]
MEHVKQTIRRLLQETLTIAQKLPVARRQTYIRQSLENIQDYCATFEKTFIVREITISCDQYEIGGSQHHFATLFRGPSKDASVAICITEQGSLLHRNDSPWKVYCNAGDVHPVEVLQAVSVQ